MRTVLVQALTVASMCYQWSYGPFHQKAHSDGTCVPDELCVFLQWVTWLLNAACVVLIIVHTYQVHVYVQST